MSKMKKTVAISCTLLSGIAISQLAQASSFSIGAGALVDRSAYRGYDTKVYPLPVINYDNGYLFVRGSAAGLYAYKTESDQVALQVAYLPGRFKTSHTDDYALKQLNNRKLSFMAGASYSHRADWGNINLNVMTDVSGNSKGTIADLGYGYGLHFAQLYIEPKVGLEWQDHKYNNYYYGVSDSESARSGLNKYDADNGVNPYIAVNSYYKFSKNWQAFVLARYTYLSSQIKDSPMTDRSSAVLVGAGVTYRF
ncbi:MipA/OmpV family protein [Utexia brackfieldae]|uniref:MipA/OmpV family protein n=1 Tax=Utexia brackfieldae TaxID=3074108 RepID=UPI00370D3E8C